MNHRGEIFLLLLSLSGLANCSSYKRNWNQSVSAQFSAPSSDLQGPWEGEWISEASGHKGKLRCLVTPSTSPVGNYHFHYWAKWGLLSGDFETVYPVIKGTDCWLFEGDTDLGSLGGVYRHQGHATTSQFHAAYTSNKGDRGTFTMKRPDQ